MDAEGQPSVASEAELEAFSRLPLEERSLTESLRGVLAEAALTGCVRYKWSLLRPLVDYVMEQVLLGYDSETRVEIGPPGPDNVTQTIDAFKRLLAAFTDAPWTLQRLCEILLEPKRQYTRLPKLILAIEKCLLVTTEVPPTPAQDLPPLPLLSTLGPVNVNPPAPAGYQSSHQHSNSHGVGGVDDSAAFTHTVLELRHPPHHGNHTGTPEHIEEDHWPEGKGPYKPAGMHRSPSGGHGHGAQPCSSSSSSNSSSNAAGASDSAGALHGAAAGAGHAGGDPMQYDMATLDMHAATDGGGALGSRRRRHSDEAEDGPATGRHQHGGAGADKVRSDSVMEDAPRGEVSAAEAEAVAPPADTAAAHTASALAVDASGRGGGGDSANACGQGDELMVEVHVAGEGAPLASAGCVSASAADGLEAVPGLGAAPSPLPQEQGEGVVTEGLTER